MCLHVLLARGPQGPNVTYIFDFFFVGLIMQCDYQALLRLSHGHYYAYVMITCAWQQ